MSDSRDASYYEIARTNRQVVMVFIVLLLCVVAAFFSGIWIGQREGLVPSPGGLAAAVEGASPDESAEPEEERFADLNFFSDPSEPEVADATPGGSSPGGAAAEAAVLERPPAADSPSEPPEVASADPPATAPAEGALVVQVFSSGDRQQDQRVVDRLRAAGYAALLAEVSVRDRTMYRVRIGPFGEEREAERVADQVRRDFRLDTWITRG